MAKPALTEAIQDYLRAIYKLGEEGGSVSVTDPLPPQVRLDETAAAFHYSFHWWIHKRVNCRHVARYDLAAPQLQCTNVFCK